MLKISYANCLGLFSAISLQFSVEICAASKNGKKITKNPFLEGSGRLNLKKTVTSACYDKQHVCTYLQPFSHYTSQ